MAFRTENNVASQLISALAGAVSTDSMTLLYARRQISDLNADSAEFEAKQAGEARIAGIASYSDGTSWYGYGTQSAWADRTTAAIASDTGSWSWRAVLGSSGGLEFYEAADDLQFGWSAFPPGPIEQTAFAIADLVFGSNGREAGVHDFAIIRLWDHPRDLGALLNERGSEWALASNGLVLDKRGTGANLSAALAAGTGSMTTGGTVVLNADLPSTVGSAPTPSGLIRPALNAGYSTLSGYLQ